MLLLVEDHARSLIAMRELLADSGFRVLGPSRKREAVARSIKE